MRNKKLTINELRCFIRYEITKQNICEELNEGPLLNKLKKFAVGGAVAAQLYSTLPDNTMHNLTAPYTVTQKNMGEPQYTKRKTSIFQTSVNKQDAINATNLLQQKNIPDRQQIQAIDIIAKCNPRWNVEKNEDQRPMYISQAVLNYVRKEYSRSKEVVAFFVDHSRQVE